MDLIKHAEENGIKKGSIVESIRMPSEIRVQIIDKPYIKEYYGRDLLMSKVVGLSHIYKQGEEIEDFLLSDEYDKLTVKAINI